MLNKLRRQIVIMNLILVGLVLGLVFGFFTYNSYRDNVHLVEDALDGSIKGAVYAAEMEFPEQGQMPANLQQGQVPENLQQEQTPEDPAQGQPQGQSGSDTTISSGADTTTPSTTDNTDAPTRTTEKTDSGKFPTTNMDGRQPGKEDGKGPLHMTPTITLQLDEEGTISRVFNSGVSLDDESLEQFIGEAELTEGKLLENKTYSVYYTVQKNKDTTYLAIADASRIYDDLRATATRSAIAWLAFMAVFLLISIRMTNYSLAPVKRSWDQQQQFVADASHELKTPLTVILANNSILAEDATLSESGKQWVESTEQEATHMQTLVNHLLYLARSDAGSQKMILQELALSDMVSEDILQFEPVAFERGVTIDESIENDIKIEGDATMIKQLVHILLDNACKFAPENSAIRIALKRDRGSVTLSVNNGGEPIPAEDLPHLFERFYRSDKARTQTESGAGGYGLGLAIAEAIAKDHKAGIDVTSNEKDGTTFTVRFTKIL